MHGGTARGHAAAWCLRLVAAALLALLPLGVAPSARAHSELVSSSPAAGSPVGLATDRIVLVFASEPLPGTSAVVVRDPEGRDVTTAGSGSSAEVVEAPVELRLAGRHDVSYRVVGEDGHVISGTVWFTGATGASPVPNTAATSQDAPSGASATLAAPGTVMWTLLASLLGVAVAVHLLGSRARHRGRAAPDREGSAS